MWRPLMFNLRRSMAFAALSLTLVACGTTGIDDADAGTDAGTNMGGTGGGNGGTGGGTGTVTWCDVKPMLDQNCITCHGNPPLQGAPVLMTRDQFAAASPLGGTMLDRSIARMRVLTLAAAMPPSVGGTAEQIALMEAWRTNNLQNCDYDGGVVEPVDAGNVTPVCTSNQYWNGGTSGRTEMNPGEACQACHQSRGRGPLDGFMGTVYPTLHELPFCKATSVPAGLTVEILTLGGAVQTVIPVSQFSNGNFRGGTFGVPSPYRARVKVNGVIVGEMRTAQTSGDCNSCHTSAGTQAAPGRIHW